MPTTHTEFGRLLSYKVFAYSEASNSAVLQLMTKDEGFLCLVSQEDLLNLSASFQKYAEMMD